MHRKTYLLFVVIFLSLFRPAKSDEGMWLPFLINDMLYDQMKEMGLELTREQIFSLNESSMKDAIVIFGGGCTGEIISPEGLLLTNHHCGYGTIQARSSVENDYLSDGFWAMTREEEIPNPGLSVRFLVYVRDVTEDFQASLHEQMSYTERSNTISQVTDRLVTEASDGNDYLVSVRPMYEGNEFYLFAYERFNDVRLVGTPPSSIGKFGGDTDNWMWPRHTGDFALFRVYTAPDGSPASYSPENIPLQSKHHLPVSIRGVQEGDFSMILGFPGSTDRYLTSMGINFRLQNEFPVRIDIRRSKLDIIEAAMAESDEIRIKYASRQSGISNYWKNFIGMSTALEKHNVAATKQIREKSFMNWANANPQRQQQYGEVMDMFAEAYTGLESLHSFNFIFREAILTGPDVLRMANIFDQLAQLLRDDAPESELKQEANRLRSIAERAFRNHDPEVDRKLLAAMLQTFYERVPIHLQPPVLQEIHRRFRGDFDRFSHEVFNKSRIAGQQQIEQFLERPSLRRLERDWAFRAARGFYDQFEKVREDMQQYEETLATARRLFIKGLREMNPDGLFYPDANFTMRFTFGSVRGYWPADAIYYDYITTLDGVLEKEDANHHEFVVPEKLTELYHAGDFGEYDQDGVMIVNFIANNDITGGNSGSPVLDGQGNLIGLAFDGNWEAMSGDILFENRTQRCINVDARYILFIIEKFAGAGHLIEEMTIVR